MPQFNTFLHPEDGLAELSPYAFKQLCDTITAAMQPFSEAVQLEPGFAGLDSGIVSAILAQKNNPAPADVFLVSPSTFPSDEQKVEIDDDLATFPQHLFVIVLLTESETARETTAWLKELATRHPNAIVLAKSAIQAELSTRVSEFLAQRDPAPE